jgi:hypothetical protein
MRAFYLSFLLFVGLAAEGQSLAGKYDTRNESHTNTKHYEELILNTDSTFSYSTRMELIKINKKGTWFVVGDTVVLNENDPCCKDKMIVEEKCNKHLPKGKVRFTVTSLQGEDINYHLVVTNKDSTQTIWSMTGITELKIKKLKSFYFIVNSLIISPEYVVKSSRSNEFKIRLAPSRFFYNEKWLVRNGMIVPIGWDNKYASYYLARQTE